MEGCLFYFVNTRKDMMKSIYTIPQNCGDFLILLNTYRAAFVALDKAPDTYNDKVIVRTGVVNKIVKLCQKYGFLLGDEEERKRCSAAIYDMCKDVNDSFLEEMLTIAGKALEKGKFADEGK